MATPSAMFGFTAVPASLTVNAETTYTFSINSQYSYHSGDRGVISFPVDVLLGGNYQCSSQTAELAVSC